MIGKIAIVLCSICLIAAFITGVIAYTSGSVLAGMILMMLPLIVLCIGVVSFIVFVIALITAKKDDE